MDRRQKLGYAHWTIRRRIIVSTLLFCAAIVIYCVYQNSGTRTEETVIQFSYTLAGTVIGTYVFGAVWEDVRNGVSTSTVTTTSANHDVSVSVIASDPDVQN